MKNEKLMTSLEKVVDAIGITDGMTISFHHHFRNGDRVVNRVMECLARKGIKDLHLAASGLFPCHEPLVHLMDEGVVTSVTTSTFNSGPVAEAISKGHLKNPAILMTHGGRARAIEDGELHIDVAFIAAPTCDCEGNANGVTGDSACGFLSYAYADAQHADHVVIVTDHLVSYPAYPIEIRENLVDYVVKIDCVGDPKGIVSGTTKITDDPVRLSIADHTAELIDQLGFIQDGFSFQTGASSTSLAVAAKVKERMEAKRVQGAFALGGIHAYLAQMLEDGYFKTLLDTQCFDLEAVASARSKETHIGISASQYANPLAKSCVVDQLDVVVLGATEIDFDFNVNVITGSDGIIRGAAGGHSDCAAGAKFAVVVTNLMKKSHCVIKKKVLTVTTPGNTIDALVTEYGIAINPRRQDLMMKIKEGNGCLPFVSMEELHQTGMKLGSDEKSPRLGERTVAIVEYRDGSTIDTVKQVLD